MSDRHQQKPYPLRIDEALRTSLEESASAAGRSLNAEIAHRLRESLGTTIPIPAPLLEDLRASANAKRVSIADLIEDLLHSTEQYPVQIPTYLEDAIREAADASGRTFEGEFLQRMHDATDVFIPALREAIEPYRAEIQEEAELNGSTFKQEIARRLNTKPAVTYGFELTIRNEAELTPAAALKFLAELVSEWPVDPVNLGALTVKLVAPPAVQPIAQSSEQK